MTYENDYEHVPVDPEEQEYNQRLLARRAWEREVAEDVLIEWTMYDARPVPAEVFAERRRVARQFARLLPLEKMLEALDITYRQREITDHGVRLRYFCGVCWRMVNTG